MALSVMELRVGNFFINPSNKVEDFEGCYSGARRFYINPFFGDDDICGYSEEEINPIPLENTWLQNMGLSCEVDSDTGTIKSADWRITLPKNSIAPHGDNKYEIWVREFSD